MKRLLLFVCLSFSLAVFAQTDSLLNRIILIGDAGLLKAGHNSVVDAVKRTFPFDAKTTIIYLGDNVYPNGFGEPGAVDYRNLQAALDTQINIARNSKATVYMLPGNHDWENGKRSGYDAILREGAYVNSSGQNNVFFYPQFGCAGPVEISLGKEVTLVMIDSQWWLHTYDKPTIESDCEFKTKDEVLNELTEILRRNYKKLVIFACHHPFKSNGIHGGYFGLKQHIFPFTDINRNLYIPLPVIGSIYPISRSVFGSPQDLKHPAYENMVADIQRVIKSNPNVIFVSGHEHNLQFIKDSSYNYIVSGSGSKTNRVEKGPLAKFVSQTNGFAALEIKKNKTVRVKFFTVEKDSVNMPFTDTLLDFSHVKEPGVDTTSFRVPEFRKTFTAPASTLYSNPSAARKFLIGNNYRRAWSTPVTLKVFHLSEQKGGLKIESMGGGKQTKSLTLADPTGKKWTLRTIDKDPEKALPDNFRTAMAKDLVQDYISASHPYGALVVPTLAGAAGIPAASPEYFFVPDDQAFSFYRLLFANKICLLEEKDASFDATDTKSTFKIIDKTLDNKDDKIDQKAVLNARLLDILIGDWDRHWDQWKWGTKDTGKGKLYYPIPKDRDQAFFNSDGKVIRMASKKMLPFLKGFKSNIPDINHLGFSPKDFDRMFMNQLTARDWDSISARFVSEETDAVIDSAVRALPPEIYGFDGSTIAEKLKSRRAVLQKNAAIYYRFLARKVNVLGSNEAEYFKIDGVGNGDLNVRIYKKKKNSADTGRLYYHRIFQPSETKEITIYGFNGDDSFVMDSSAVSNIRVRIIGGYGDDTFRIRSNVRTTVYDQTIQKNYLEKGGRTKKEFDRDAAVNDYDLKEYKYDIRKFPSINLGYNLDDGLMLGAGVYFKDFGFRKFPYAYEQNLRALVASNKAFQIKYDGTFVHLINKLDLVAKGSLENPALHNFFGLGNKTTIASDKRVTFYRARYNYIAGELLLRKRYFDKLSIMVGPYFYRYWNHTGPNDRYVLAHPQIVGLDSASVYSGKSYFGGKAVVLLNNLNNALFPSRGIYWNNELTVLKPITTTARSFSSIRSDMAVYASLTDPANVIAVLRLGAGHIFQNKYEYFQAMTLGSDSYLRGFRKDRFAGTSVAYSGLELRVKLFESKSYIFPGQVGVIGFDEIGRVWLEGEHSRAWHNAVGGGFYYIPYDVVIISATVGFSKEEQILNFSIGTKFNLTF